MSSLRMNRLFYFCLSSLCLSFLSIAFSSCNKKSISPCKIANNLGAEVTVNVYGSRDDYNNINNPIKTLKISAGTSQSVEFESLGTYWLDWYTADFLRSNWASKSYGEQSLISSPSRQITIAPEDNGVEINSGAPDISRSVLLNGNELGSSWRVDISSIPELTGTHIYTFRRDNTGLYKYTSSTGSTTETPIKFSMTLVSGLTFRMDVVNEKEKQIADVFFNSMPNSYPHYGRDTIQVNIKTPGYSGTYFTARRL